MARRGDERLAAGQRPFRPHFGPVAAAQTDAPLAARVGQTKRPFGARQASGRIEPGDRLRQIRSVGRRIMVLRVEGHRIGRRVVQCPEKKRVLGNHDAPRGQLLAYVRVIQQDGQQSRIDLARIAAAGAAMQGARVGVVDDVCAMAGENHESREILGERHGPQHALRRCVRVARSSGGSKRGAGSSGAGPCCNASASRKSLPT